MNTKIKTANLEQLKSLWQSLLDRLTEALSSSEKCTAYQLYVARQFLKDNGINADALVSNNKNTMAAQLETLKDIDLDIDLGGDGQASSWGEEEKFH
ncbi:hypothetical protein [Magnetospira sp. QH-2]|uniref:hypothetical protein n=1 Tax=Magnetospira sp. (strain QH-2) TaxID=1288970 RepID=UPI0003E81BC4|nr:hypothetical protein [Magnetospira sp. QH-2]CCQ73923.1 Protein of unknown function [Magnetospira sp. QH-2]